MKKTISAVLCCLLTAMAIAQSPKIDSLNRLIGAGKPDSVRADLMLSKAEIYSTINLDSSLVLCREVLAEGLRLNLKKIIVGARVQMAQNFCFKGNFDSARQQLDLAGPMAKEANKPKLLDNVSNGYGIYYGMQAKYDSSCFYFLEGIKYAEQTKDTSRLMTAYRNLASSYQMQARYSEAIHYAQLALKMSELKNDQRMRAYILMNLGTIYSGVSDSVRAEEYLLKCIELAHTQRLVNVELYASSNLASMYVAEKRYQEGYDLSLKANKLAQTTGDPAMEATTTSYMSVALEGLGHPKTADSLGLIAITLARKSNQALNIFQTETDYGDLLSRQKNYKEAIKHYEASFAAMKGGDLFDNQFSKSYLAMSDAYEKVGRFREALTAFQAGTKIKDSITSKENVRKTTENALNAEFEKKDQTRKLERDRENQTSKNKQRLLIAGLLLTLLVAGGAWYAFSVKRNANLLLQTQKTALESALTELKATQTQLIESEKMASLGELTAGIAHEIQNPLNFVNNFSEVSVELIDELKSAVAAGNSAETAQLSADLSGNLEKIIHHGKRADAIVKSMLQHSRRNGDQKEITDLNQLADEYLRLSYHGLRAKNKSFNAQLHSDFDPALQKTAVVPQDIGRVLLNLLTNAFYAIDEKSKKQIPAYQPSVWMSTRQNGQAIYLSIRDNGDGIPDGVREKMFQPFFTTKPTGQGTGLGLSLSYDIVRAHDGEITVETKPGEGTEFVIRLPVSTDTAVLNPKS